MKLASIVICCYNGKAFIDKCFSCIIGQTYSNIEVIFVDDGSTDGSYQYALTFRSNFEDRGFYFKCFTQENKGAGGATALGLLHATGDFISCYDVDDILYPESVERRAAFLIGHADYAGVRTNGYKISPDKTKSLFVNDEEERQKTDIFSDLLFGKTNNWSGSYMVKSSALWSVFPDHHIIESRFGQNLQILMSVAYQNKIGFIDIPLMEYVYNLDSFTNSGKDLNDKIRNYNGYKEIRLGILKKLGVDDQSVYKKLDVVYLTRYLDLALEFKDENLYKESYEQLVKIEKPLSIYTYYYYKLQNYYLLPLLYRIKYKLMKK